MDVQELSQEYLIHPMHKDLDLSIDIGVGKVSLVLMVQPNILNLVGIMHGSYYFKLMDDACFFAALSLKKSKFVATANFTIHYFRPASSGRLIAEAHVLEHFGKRYVCECVIKDEEGKKYGCGSGLFVEPKRTYDYSTISKLKNEL